MDGQTGGHGAVAASHVVVAGKHACAHVPILHQPLVVPTAKEIVPRFSLATSIGVQVRLDVL